LQTAVGYCDWLHNQSLFCTEGMPGDNPDSFMEDVQDLHDVIEKNINKILIRVGDFSFPESSSK
jgi:hypothetical protein